VTAFPEALSTPTATIVIATKNRKDELRRALASTFTQTAPLEVVVIDDGSSDGTADLIRAEFPAVRLYRREHSTGYIAARNEGARSAAQIVVSIDDDAAFPSRFTVEQTVREFDHPRVGAVAIPFVNVHQDEVVRQRAPAADRVYVTDRYIGTAHAVRRDVFLAVGGYREHFVHQGEEGDLCLRMLAAGYVVRLGAADPIHHFESNRRSYARMDYYGRRNDVLFAWHNVPGIALPVHLGASTANGLRHMLRTGRWRHGLMGLAAGYARCARYPTGRSPVPWCVYRLGRELKAAGATPLEAIEKRLTPLREVAAAPPVTLEQ
jgi:GT2 family glycosyltransferase